MLGSLDFKKKKKDFCSAQNQWRSDRVTSQRLCVCFVYRPRVYVFSSSLPLEPLVPPPPHDIVPIVNK